VTHRLEGSLVLQALSGDLSNVPTAELAAFVEAQMSEEERKELQQAVAAGDEEKLEALGYRNLNALSAEELRQIAAGNGDLDDGA
jgi:hypothetical protein